MLETMEEISLFAMCGVIGIAMLTVTYLLFYVVRRMEASLPAAKTLSLFTGKDITPPREKIKPVAISDAELWRREQGDKDARA